MSQYVARNLRPRQGNWNRATQNRIPMTTTVIGAMKHVKMLGLQNRMSAAVKNLRRVELQMARKVRWLMVVYNASANALGMFAPVLTLTLFAISAEIQGYQLDARTAFTTTALLIMITHPANMVMTIIPRATASFSSFERIQGYLLEPVIHPRQYHCPSPNSSAEGMFGQNIQEANLPLAITIEHVSVGPLSNISLSIQKGSLVVLSGPTAAGKSSLALAILGEIPSQSGTIKLFPKHIGYCAQAPWLPSGTVKEVIQGFVPTSSRDQKWHQEVIRSCCLEKDIQDFPARDDTLVGPGGMNLSGGQRQRLASSLLSMVMDRLLVAGASPCGICTK